MDGQLTLQVPIFCYWTYTVWPHPCHTEKFSAYKPVFLQLSYSATVWPVFSEQAMPHTVSKNTHRNVCSSPTTVFHSAGGWGPQWSVVRSPCGKLFCFAQHIKGIEQNMVFQSNVLAVELCNHWYTPLGSLNGRETVSEYLWINALSYNMGNTCSSST